MSEQHKDVAAKAGGPLRNGWAKWLAIGGLVLAVVVVLAMLWPSRGGSRRLPSTAAKTNMRALVMAVRMYMMDHNKLPDDVAGALYVSQGPDTPNGLATPKPSSLKDPRWGKQASPPPVGDEAALKAWFSKECDFYYAGAGLNVRNVATEYDIIMFYDKDLDPKGTRLVAFYDTHVEQFERGSPGLQHVADETNKLRAAQGLKPLPAGLVGPVEEAVKR